MLEWKSDYETGLAAIDAQHKVLFGNINRIETLLNKPEIETEEVDYLLAFLEDYAMQHFNGEEACMARYCCPAFEKNKDQHAQFLNILRFSKEQYENRNHPRELLERLHESMVWWITNHILKVDVQLKGCTGEKKDADQPAD